jgi:lysozyme family protein
MPLNRMERVMETNWNACLAFVFSVEGGYTDDPMDPGGATNLGITLDELSVWRHSAVTKGDVMNLGRDEAGAVYRANYWNAMRCADLPAGVDLMVFDAAVNTGNGRSAKFLQAACRTAVDGAIGPRTLAAAHARPAAALIAALAAARLAFYQGLPTFSHFGHGWTDRVQQAQSHALQMSFAGAATQAAPSGCRYDPAAAVIRGANAGLAALPASS